MRPCAPAAPPPLFAPFDFALASSAALYFLVALTRASRHRSRVIAASTTGTPSSGARPLPPALLFVTLHGDKDDQAHPGNALVRYRLTGGHSRNGKATLSAEPLGPVSLTLQEDAGKVEPEGGASALLMPRGMALLLPDTLLIASAADALAEAQKGSILAVSARAACAASGGLAAQAPVRRSAGRPDARVAARVFAVDGVRHPYGVTVSPSPGKPGAARVVVANQGSGRVLWYDPGAFQGDGGGAAAAAKGGSPRPLRPSAELARHCTDSALLTPGTTGVRGAASSDDGSVLFVACRTEDAVYAHSPNGSLLGAIRVPQPIALTWGDVGETKGLFIGSDGAESDDGVVTVAFWDASQGMLTQRYSHRDGGGHAAGIARFGAALLVLGQDRGALHQFDAATGDFVSTLVTGMKRPEALLVWTGLCEDK